MMYQGKKDFTVDCIGAMFGTGNKNKKQSSQLKDKNNNEDVAVVGAAFGLGMPPHLKNKD